MVAGLLLILALQLSVQASSALLEFDNAQVLPEGSELVNLNGHKLHVRKLGKPENPEPYLLLLSGPTDNWHSDSGWWSLAQTVLAEKYYTIAIDRAEHTWSEPIAKPSYRQFGQDLSRFIVEQQKSVVLVAFASSNLSLHKLMADQEVAAFIRGAVLIDPDVLTDHSINHYSTETERYREGWEGIEEFITSGKYDRNIRKKINGEREHLKSIISSELESYMDWDYYTAVEAIRNTRSYQLEKFREATHYRQDLIEAQKYPLPDSLPLVVIDSDFESAYLPKIDDESVKASIVQWRDEGKRWFFELAQKSRCGGYWPIETPEHLVMMEQPKLIARAVEKIQDCEQKN